MSRGLSASMESASGAQVVRPILLFEAQFDSGTLYMWSGVGDLSYGGHTYAGAGSLISVDVISEVNGTQSTGITVQLSGIPDSLITNAMTENYQERLAIVTMALLDENESIIASPVVLFSGPMDALNIQDSGNTIVLNMSIENRLIALETPRISRYTDEEQKIRYAGDKGFEYVNSIQELPILWGKTQG